MTHLMLSETHTSYWVALGAEPTAWDASLRETICADGATRVVAQFFPHGRPEGDTGVVKHFTNRTDALVWLVEQYAAQAVTA